MHKKYPLVRDWKLPLTLLGASVASGLAAQTAPEARTASEDADVYVLSPFEVTSERDVGYLATETLAGTRIRTDLRDVASSISVITKELMNDIGATGNDTLLQYTTNAEVAGTRGTYSSLGSGQSVHESGILINPSNAQRVRGLSSADMTRDYFGTEIPWDSFNVDRIDIQRGPNSILFGLGSPAGIISATTRSAQYANSGALEFRVGSYGSVRSSVDINRVIIDEVLAVRFDALVDREQFQQSPAFENDERFYGTLRWDPKLFGRDFKTSIKVKYEHGEIEANRPRIVPPSDSITPWFASAADGGMGKYTVTDLYALGSNAAATNAWLGSIAGNQQVPVFFIDGNSGNISKIWGGYINNGFRKTDGTLRGVGESAIGQRYSEMLYGLTNYSTYATNSKLVNYLTGQYKNQSLQDSSVFDFYNNLIDGNTKKEWSDWDAYNISISQMGWGDMVGIELSYDHQELNRGGQSLLGGNPALNIDVTAILQDGSENPNYGRPFVSSNNGSGSSYSSERDFLRASAFVELRASDIIDNDFIAKMIGRHRFNAVASKETWKYEDREWRMYANSNDWDKYWRNNSGLSTAFTERPPVAVVYLGDSLASNSTASGAYIPGITGDVALRDGKVYLFDSTWTATNVAFDAPYSIPADNAWLNKVFNAEDSNLTSQVSNHANYKGWGNNFDLAITQHGVDGAELYTKAQKVERVTTSYVGTWQGFMLNEAVIPLIGWRYDSIKTRSKTAAVDATNKNHLILDDTYTLPEWSNAPYTDHSLAGGVVVHINKLLPKDFLPLNVSLSYNESNNFQVSSARVDLYGNALSNPTGETSEYGLRLSTKDGKYSFGISTYETSSSNAYISNENGFSDAIVQGLRFRNVFLYQLTGYTWDSRVALGTDPGTGGTRWWWFPAFVDEKGLSIATAANEDSAVPDSYYKRETVAEAAQHRDAVIRDWNDIQKFLDARGYFQVWGYTPQDVSKLTDRATYEASLDASNNPSAQYMPTNPATQIYTYGFTNPAGYTITGNTKSEGFELEFTANPTKNWRITLNAAKTEAIKAEIGGAQYDELISFLDEKMAGFAGDMRRWNGEHVPSNTLRTAYNSFRSRWTLMKLQENAAASELRKWRFNVVTNYSFTEGKLNGLGVGAAYRWQDEVILGYPVSTDSMGLAVFDLDNPYYGPAEDGLDFWISYKRDLSEKVSWKIQLNVRNAFASDGVVPISVQPDGKTWASVRTKPVQEWFLTNTFSF